MLKKCNFKRRIYTRFNQSKFGGKGVNKIWT